MKALLITTLVMGFISVSAASAAQEINRADGKEKIG
jgi:multiple stress resistance protein BhsA